MKKEYADIIIIGAGAAGLMAAYGAASSLNIPESGRRVLVLERMPRPARKIMITGKGRCNFTNIKAWNEFSSHIHPKPDFLKPAFYNLSSEKMLEFLEDHGMRTVVERGDRAFPESHLASDVVDTLVLAARNAGAEILCNKEVLELSRSADDPQCYEVRCSDSQTFICSKLILCTGGLSYPKTGSDGDGYRWAKEFRHEVKPLFPSLTAIVPKGYKETSGVSGTSKGHIHRSNPLSEYGKSLCGNQLKNISLTVIIDGNEVQNEFGDIDFTDGGLEGPVGFKVSRRCVNAILNGSKVTVIIDLKPAVEMEQLAERIRNLWDEISKDRRNSQKTYKDRFRLLLGKLLPMSLIPGFVKTSPALDHKSLPKALKCWKMEMEGYVGYERCVVTAGGVSLKEVTPKTLESKLMEGLYFAGEVLDLDADTGGYNLQTAFSTGCLAGMSAARSLCRSKE